MNGQYKIGDVVLSNWKLVRLLGEGSYGRVYEAERSDFGTVYKSAVKIMTIPQNQSEVASARAEGMTDVSVTSYFKGFVEEIAREFSLMAQLKGNSNIVSYEDHQVIPHTVGIGWDIIIRMELLTPLNSRLTGQGMSMRDIIKLGTDMCRALEICEKHNIIHRDIKPENIFINELGDYKLGDFGIARSIEQTNMSLSKKGTYNYMAPEVYKEEHYDKTVDIYSLGIVLYRLLNFNRTPFLPEYPNQISHAERENAIARRMRGDAIPMPVNAKNVLGAVVLKACAYNPADRYTSPSQFREDLEAVLRGEMPVYACQQKTQPIAQPKPPVVPDKPGTEVTHTEPASQNGIKARIKTFLSSLKPLHKALIGGGAALVVLLVVLACVLPGGGKSDPNANSSDGSETEVTVVEKGNKTIVNNTDGTSFIQKLKNGEIVSVEFESEYGEPTEITFYGGDMSKPHEVIFEDDSGNRVRYYEFDRNGKIIIHTASKFDGSGRVISETEYDSTGKAKNVSEYAYQGSETVVTCFDGNGSKIAERRLDADGRSILEKSFAGGSVVSWTETEYKPDGSYIVTEKNGSGVATTQTKCSSSGTDLWKAELIDGDISVLHDYANGCDWDYYYSENGAGSFVYRIATYDTVSWHWSDGTVQMGYTSAYVAIIDDPVENCIGYTYTQTNTGSSSCFGPWKAYFCNNGTWGSCAEFEIPEDSSGGTGTGTVEISFDSPVTLSGAGARFAGNRGFSYSSSCDITNVKVIDYEYYPD